jgi:hypothetical protein
MSSNREALLSDLNSSAFLSADSPGSSKTRVAWRLHRDGHSARCVICTVGDRVELHITMTYDVVMFQQCKGPEQASAISTAWWSALIDRGWTEGDPCVTLRPKVDRRSQTDVAAAISKPETRCVHPTGAPETTGSKASARGATSVARLSLRRQSCSLSKTTSGL